MIKRKSFKSFELLYFAGRSLKPFIPEEGPLKIEKWAIEGENKKRKKTEKLSKT